MMIILKDVLIHYNTAKEQKSRDECVSVFLDGERISNLLEFTIVVKKDEDPVCTVKQLMDYPTDPEYII